MISIQSLYDPIRHRYKGVYPMKKGWQAIVLPLYGGYTVLGTWAHQEGAARAVATYYRDLFGEDWEEMLKSRRSRAWTVKKIARTSKLTVWVAQIKHGKKMVNITPEHLGAVSAECSGWVVAGDGWETSADALVAVRTIRFLHGITSVSSVDQASCLA